MGESLTSGAVIAHVGWRALAQRAATGKNWAEEESWGITYTAEFDAILCIKKRCPECGRMRQCLPNPGCEIPIDA